MYKILKPAIIFLIICLNINLNAEAVFSGNITTVDPRSGFNALRNPALMSFRVKDDISLGYMYSYLAHSETEADVSLAGVPFDSDVKSEQDYDGAFIFSTVTHSGKSAYGLGITKGSDGQVVLSSTETVIDIPPAKYISDEDKELFSSTLLLSYSYRVNNRSSLGIQLEAMASEASKKAKIRLYSSGSLSEYKVVDSEQSRATAGVAAGYFFTGSSYEFGAGIKSGRFGFENKKYDYYSKTISPFLEAKNDKKIPNYYIHDDSIGLVTGINFKPYYGFSYAFEAAAALPYTHEEKECDVESVALDKSSTEVNLKYAYQLKGGVTYKWGRRTTLGAGLGYLNLKSESENNDTDSSGNTDYSVFQATAGADIKLTYALSFMFGVNYNILGGHFEQKGSGKSFKMDQNSHTVDFISGISSVY